MSKQKLVLIIIAVLVGGGIIAFIVMSALKEPTTDTEKNLEEQTTSEEQNELEQTSAKLSKDGTVLTITVTKNTSITENLPTYFEYANSTPIEIELSGQDGSEVDLLDNLDLSGVNIPSKLLQDTTNIKLYLYQGAEDLGPSEAILIKNNNTAEENLTIMKNWEQSGMIDDLKSFVLIGEANDWIADSGASTFSTSTKYPNTRFVNFTSDNAISINYTAGEGFILITNSYSIQEKMTRNILSF